MISAFNVIIIPYLACFRKMKKFINNYINTLFGIMECWKNGILGMKSGWFSDFGS